MALSLKISWYLTAEGPPEVEMEPAWWDIQELSQSYDFTEINVYGYRDWELIVSRETLKKIHLEQKPNAFEGRFAYDKWKQLNQSMMEDIDIMIGSPLSFHRISIRIYEWESYL